MSRKIIRYLLIASTLLLFSSLLTAQSSQSYLSAVELYDKGLYADAQRLLTQAKKEASPTNKAMLSDINFYEAMCAVKLKQSNAEALAEKYLTENPESGRKSEVAFNVALTAYENGKYNNVIKWLKQVEPSDLTESQQGEYSFKYGYSLLKTNKSDKAADYFAQVKDSKKSRYAPSATFYYAHIAYEKKNYAAALKHFEKIKDETEFEDIVPFYMLQIYFYQKEYDKVIANGEAIYKKSSDARAPEVARIMAEAYQQKGDNTKALEWFEKYNTSLKGKHTPADSYLMALTYFELGRYDDAIKFIEKQTITSNEIGQNIAYLQGAIYLKLGSKEKASAAFQKASKITANKDVATDAQLNYAKLQLELKGDAAELKKFIEKNPSSTELEDVRALLAEVYIGEKKFQDAINLLNLVTEKTKQDKANLQKAAYYNGLALYKAGSYVEAEKNFNLAIENASDDAALTALAKYWKSETDYRMGSYDKAKEGLTEYLNTSGAFKSTTEYKMAHYTLGYCYFRENDYDQAISWFRKFINLSGNDKTPFVADCYNRIGDCYFTQRKFTSAIESYNKSVSLNLAASDYAMYQSAMAQGMAGRSSQKKEQLNKLISQYPKSSYIPAAWFELGRLSVEAEKYADAVKSFEVIEKSHPSSSYYPKALVELGLAMLNLGNEDKALEYYKKVVEKYPTRSEAQDALIGIKNIYMDNGNINEYFAYTSKIGKGETITDTEKDSLSFVSAERIYLQEDCKKAIPALKAYIGNSENSSNKLTASYYIGDCYYREGSYTECVEYLSYVINQPKSSYTEDALARAAKAYWELETYDKAAELYSKMASDFKDSKQAAEAQTVAMRGYYLADSYPEAANAATKLLAYDKLDKDLTREAQHIKARSLHQIGQDSDAKKVYEILIKEPKTAEGAEAYYHYITILYSEGKLDATEEAVIKFSESQTPYMGWLARSFIVLGDVNVDRGNYFQARETYKSIANGYKNKEDGVLATVQERLDAIDGKE